MQPVIPIHGTLPCPSPAPPRGKAVRIALLDVELSANARQTIGLAVKEIAARTRVPEQDLAARMQGEVYWRPDLDHLLFVMATPEIDAVMYVEIPSAHWRFREPERTVH